LAAGGEVQTSDLVSLRQQIDSLVVSEGLAMVASTIDQVKDGHYQALKYLFEMIGLYPATGEQERPEEDSLARVLLNYLGVSENQLPQAPGKERPSENVP